MSSVAARLAQAGAFGVPYFIVGLIAALFALSLIQPAAAQGGLASPSAGCLAANNGDYDFDVIVPPQSFMSVTETLTINESFAAGEFLTFSFTNTSDPNGGIDQVTIEDQTTGSSAPIINEDFPSTNIATRTVPSDGARTIFLSLSMGGEIQDNARMTVTCESVPQGNITITKTADADGTFAFESAELGNFSLTTPSSASASFTNLSVGTYTVTETASSEFILDSINCSGGSVSTDTASRSATITLLGGEDVQCTFNNLAVRGSITIEKESDVAGSFDFSGDNGIGSFSLSPGAGAAGVVSTSFSDLLADTYTITEAAVTGFDLASIDCGSAQGVTTNVSAGTATIALSAGENVTCRFVNQQLPGSIRIVKQTDTDATFSFSGDFAFDISTSNGSGENDLGSQPAGTYTITEDMLDGFSLDSISCDDPDGGTTTDVASRTATIDLDPDEDIVCTFTNSELTGSITVVKEADVDDTFSFTGDLNDFSLTTSGGTAMQTFADLSAGSFVITEAANASYALESISCTSDLSGSSTVDLDNRQVTVDLTPNENVTCTFTNAVLPGSITILKETDGDDGTFGFTGDLGTFSIATTNAAGSTSFPGLSAALFVVTEDENDDFDLVDIRCEGDLDGESVIDIPARQVSIDLDAGESISCTFVNEDSFDEDQFMDDTKEAIGGYMYRRARSMLNAEPDRASFTRSNPNVLWGDAENREPVQYAFNATAAGTQLDVQASTTVRSNDVNSVGQVELWIEGHFTRAEDEADLFDIESEFSIFHLGADIQVTENIIIGALASFDKAEEDATFFDEEGAAFLSHFIEGTGWMAGPYMSARLRDNLFFNARVAYGESDNDLTLFGFVNEDEFETERTLARAALTGNHVEGNWRVTPTLSVAYFEEEQQAYVSKTGVSIPSQTLQLGRAEFEPELAYRHELSTGTVIEPQLSVAAVWDFESPDDFSVRGVNISTDEFRGRIESGLQVNWTGGNSMRIAGSYDGIGSSGYEAYSLEAWIDIPLGKPKPRKRQPAPVPPAPIQQPHICPDGTRVLSAADCPSAPAPTPEELAFVVNFDHDKSILTASEIAKIDAAVAESEGKGINVVLLEGHTDLSGSRAYNEPLSLRRAVVVRDALIARGIPAEKITYEFFGERDPAVDTEDGVRLRANRRTEVVIRFD
jgi:outer membrane protein OmpA-like peptidoglycan-associated protein